MNIIIASDSYKGSLTSLEVATAVETGLRRVFSDLKITKLPVADGGEGTLDALKESVGGTLFEKRVQTPNGQTCVSTYLVSPDGKCFIEVAQASGLHATGLESVLDRSSYGTGQLIKDALEKGLTEIYITLGGSGTSDMGLGILDALGFIFKDADGTVVEALPRNVLQIASVVKPHFTYDTSAVTFHLLCDVTNPLYGSHGAARIFGPQKGASETEVEFLDTCAKHLHVLMTKSGYHDVANVPGTGAAGGIGFALASVFQSTFQSGIDTVLDLSDFDKYLNRADLVITGEGRIDNQSVHGKTPVGVARRSAKYNVPCVAVVGSIGADYHDIYNHNILAVEASVTSPQSLDTALANASKNIADASERLLRAIMVGNALK